MIYTAVKRRDNAPEGRVLFSFSVLPKKCPERGVLNGHGEIKQNAHVIWGGFLAPGAIPKNDSPLTLADYLASKRLDAASRGRYLTVYNSAVQHNGKGRSGVSHDSCFRKTYH